MSWILKKGNIRIGKGTRVRFIGDLFRAGGGYCCDGCGDCESGGFGGDGGGGGGGGSDDEENDCVTAFFDYSMPLKRQFASAACFKILSKERHPRPHCRERCYARAHPLPTVFTVCIQLYVGVVADYIQLASARSAPKFHGSAWWKRLTPSLPPSLPLPPPPWEGFPAVPHRSSTGRPGGRG